MADDTAFVMKYLEIFKADVIGCSQGGIIAQCIAAKYPDMVDKLVLAATSAKSNTLSDKVISQWIKLAVSGDMTKLGEQMISDIYSQSMIDRFKDILLLGFNNVTDDQMTNFIILSSSIINFDCSYLLKKIKSKTFAVGSYGDNVFSSSGIEEIASELNCDFYLYGNNYGHACYDEAADFREMIFNYLND